MPIYSFPPLDKIADDPNDVPNASQSMGEVGPLKLPNLIFGAATFMNQANPDTFLVESVTPIRTIRLALRYGIRAFDTSPYYGPSEIILGNALMALETQFPRSSYKLMTKCGRYGRERSSFDYSPARIRASVNQSLARLRTGYLDTVYLHDVEFVCTPVTPKDGGNPLRALVEEKAGFGLAEGEEGRIWGDGDLAILGAIAELRKMQDEGLITNVGITGYPLPVLLRLAILVLHTPPYKPLDVVLSYSHLTLQNASLSMWIPHFYERAKVKQVVAAAPLSMALLTSHPPSWHPAPKELLNVVADERERCEDVWPGGLPNLALGYSMRKAMEGDMPLAVGFSTPREVHEGMRVWTEMSERFDKEERKKFEESVRERIGQSGFLDWSWTEDVDTSGKYRSETLHASLRLVGFLFIISFLLWLFACRVFDLEMA